MMTNLGKTIRYSLIPALFLLACKSTEQKAASVSAAAPARDTVAATPSAGMPQPALDTNSAAYHFLKGLVMGEAPDGRFKELNLDRLPFSIALEDEGMPYTVYYAIVAKEDLSGDQIPDYIIRRESEGMLGGSVQTNSQLDYYIMKDSLQYVQQYSILTYAPFSYNMISDYRFDKGVLTVSLSKNFRTYPDAGETPPRDFSFVYKNGNLYETSYLTGCFLAKWNDKSIYNGGMAKVKRTRSMDEHDFTETLKEQWRVGDTSITAGLSGCDNTDLHFDVTIAHSLTDTSSTTAKKELLLAVVHSLAGSTGFAPELTKLEQFYAAHDYHEGGAEVDSRLTGTTWVRQQADGAMMVRIGITITRNEKQGDNWEVLNRVK